MSYLVPAAEIAWRIAAESWLVLGQMAPYLLLGFVVAGLLSVWVSPEWVERHLGRRGLGPVWKAALFGVPLPLCSCGVIPVAASIRRHGASRAATTSFLLSTPQTGVDSIAVTYGMLGWLFALVRPVVALATGVVGGGLVRWLAEPSKAGSGSESAGSLAADAAGGHFQAEAERSPGADQACTAPCCAPEDGRNWLVRALRYGLVTLPGDIGAPLLIGAVVAGAIGALVPPGSLAPYLGGGILAMLLMMAVGVPLYVCATASVPIAAGMIHLGASPGAALAFLIAGPATNAATVTTIWKVLGPRTVVICLATVGLSAVLGGLALDGLFAALGAGVPGLSRVAHEHAPGGAWPVHAWALLLLGLLGWSFLSGRWALRSSRSSSGAEAPEPAGTPRQNGTESAGKTHVQQVELAVEGMTCHHCVAAVRRALAECRGVAAAEVDLPTRRAVVRGEALDRERLVAAVAGLGYEAKVVQ